MKPGVLKDGFEDFTNRLKWDLMVASLAVEALQDGRPREWHGAVAMHIDRIREQIEALDEIDHADLVASIAGGAR